MTRSEFVALVRELDNEAGWIRKEGRRRLDAMREHDPAYAKKLETALNALDALHESA